MDSRFSYRVVGRGLVEYKNLQYEELILKCEKFFIKSQFDPQGLGREVPSPSCSHGQILSGKDSQGNEYELLKIIDMGD